MGDIIEITRHIRHPNQFYKVTTNAIAFEVKANNAALVGLAKEPEGTCDYWVGFAIGGMIYIQGPEGQKSNNGGSYAVSLNQYRRFWIAWDCGVLRVGQNCAASHTISYPYHATSLNYVAFCSQDQRNAATWKIQLPPASVISVANSINVPKKIEGGELTWVAADDALPDDAVIGGFESECLYITRAYFQGSQTPGKFVPSEGVSYVAWGGEANVTPEFEILCGYNFIWEPTSSDRIPVNAFVAGYSESNQEKLYIGRVNHMGNVIPGKVQASHKVCYVAFGQKEMSFNEFEILTIPDMNPYAARPYLHTNMGTVSRHPQDLGIFLNVRVNRNRQDQDDDDDDDDDDDLSLEDGDHF